jgi:hypothetical protein
MYGLGNLSVHLLRRAEPDDLRVRPGLGNARSLPSGVSIAMAFAQVRRTLELVARRTHDPLIR